MNRRQVKALSLSYNQSTSKDQTNFKRKVSIGQSQEIKIENASIIGSINLKGALIDDISFKKRIKIGDNANIVFLNPSDVENGFYIETGWTSIGNKIKVPTRDSVWTVKGNNKLNDSSPIILQWNNKEGVIFEKKIELDDKYLFTITQQVK